MSHPLPVFVVQALQACGLAQPSEEALLCRDAWTRLLRVRCSTSGSSRLLVLAEADAPEFVRQRLRREAELPPPPGARHAAVPERLLLDAAGACLVLQDPGGAPLALQGQPPPAIATALRLAGAIAQSLAECHARGLVHNDLRPANVLLGSDGRALLRGFGKAARSSEPAVPLVLTEAADMLPYMSPELTGRTNRAVDARSDLYALGVMLHALLAGQLPFRADSPMEWVHCHVARAPASLFAAVPHCPPQLVAIVEKLLSKAAESRYQSAAELLEDLAGAMAEGQARGLDGDAAPTSQLLGLATPRRLYGRAAALDALASVHRRVGEGGKPALVLVHGHSGVGKSALVQELQRQVLGQGGFFASGKFEQSRQEAPYATLAQSLGSVLAELQQQGEAVRAHWKARLSAALGSNAASLQGMLPDLATLLGASAAPHGLSPTDAAKRFQRAITNLVMALSEPGKPLVLFIDDLQWLDGATLDVLVHLLRQDELGPLLLIGAYRSNEVGADHGLHRLRGAARDAAVETTALALDDLSEAELVQLVADALDQPQPQVAALAAYLHAHTQGNPFFALQLIRALADDGLLRTQAGGGWTWDLAAIAARDQKDDVREFLTAKLALLPGDLRYRIETLSCFGAAATTRCMAVACGVEADQCGAYASAAEQAGFIRQTEDGYRFMHDRIQEAAYALMPPALRPHRHLEIARRLCAALSAEEVAAHIFDIANQLALGVGLIEAAPERLQAAALFRRAGARAQAETAYGAALRYLEHADALLGGERWETSYPLALGVAMAMAECRFLVGDLHAAELQLQEIEDRARDTVDRAAVTWLQVTLYTALDRSDVAIQTCLRFLGSAGIRIPASPGDAEVLQEYQALTQQLGAVGGARALLELPAADDPEQRAVLDVLAAMLPPAFFSDANLVCYALCRMARLSLDHGNGEASALAYAYLGMVIGPRFSAYALAFELGSAGYALVERAPLHRYRGRVYMTYAYHVCAWARPLDNSLELLRRAYQIAREGGDVTYAGFSSCTLVTTLLSQGTHLAEVQQEARERLRYVTQAGFGLVSDIITVQLQLVASLRGETREVGVFDDDAFSESAYEGRLTANRNLDIATCWYWIRKAHARFLANRFAEALDALEQAEPLLWTSAGHFEMAQYHFGAALVRAECCHGAPVERRAALMGRVAEHLSQLRTWAANSPATFNFRVALVEAEVAGVQGSAMDAMRRYEHALSEARLLGTPQHIALTLENMARFCRRAGLAGTGESLMAQARDAYLRWGANGKAALMERELPAIGARTPALAQAAAAPGALQDADVAAMLKTSQAVSHDAGLDELMRALMEIALEHAGANRGVLIMPRGEQLRVEAQARFGADGAEVLLQSLAVSPGQLPLSVLRHVIRTAETVLLDDAQASEAFGADPYIAEARCRAVLCLPLIRQKELIAVLYLENSLVSHVFTQSRVSLLKLLVVTAALYIENASLEEKESLLKEVHHRVKNNLQLISSLLSLQAARTQDARVAELFAESRNRVRSMAMVHENLYRAGNFARVPMPAHIRNLCAELTRAYSPAAQNIVLVVDVDDVQLDLNRAVSCGLIVNELLSNALKHAFRQRGGGTVHVGLHAGADGQCVLRVADDGVGLPADLDMARAATLGLQLVDDLAAQLHGVLELRTSPGADFTVRFPLSDARVYR